MPDRLTLDMTAIRDATDPSRAHHTDGLKLLALADNGVVELAVPPQGSLADLAGNYEGDLADDVRGLLERPGVIQLPQLARLSNVTFPGPDLFLGYFVTGFHEAWDAVVATWKTHQGRRPNEADRWYVEAHVCDGREF